MRKIRLTEGNLKSIISESIAKILYGGADKYECLNEARSWSEGMKKNGCPSINYGKSRTIISEGIQYEPESNEKRGNHSILNRCECGGTFPEPNRQLGKAENRHFQE